MMIKTCSKSEERREKGEGRREKKEGIYIYSHNNDEFIIIEFIMKFKTV